MITLVSNNKSKQNLVCDFSGTKWRSSSNLGSAGLLGAELYALICLRKLRIWGFQMLSLFSNNLSKPNSVGDLIPWHKTKNKFEFGFGRIIGGGVIPLHVLELGFSQIIGGFVSSSPNKSILYLTDVSGDTVVAWPSRTIHIQFSFANCYAQTTVELDHAPAVPLLLFVFEGRGRRLQPDNPFYRNHRPRIMLVNMVAQL